MTNSSHFYKDFSWTVSDSIRFISVMFASSLEQITLLLLHFFLLCIFASTVHSSFSKSLQHCMSIFFLTIYASFISFHLTQHYTIKFENTFSLRRDVSKKKNLFFFLYKNLIKLDGGGILLFLGNQSLFSYLFTIFSH